MYWHSRKFMLDMAANLEYQKKTFLAFHTEKNEKKCYQKLQMAFYLKD